jgi:hypothetical protein
MTDSSHLGSLDLSHNGMDERASLILSEHLRLNDTISELHIDENPLGPVGANLMFKLMDVIGDRRHVSIEGCNFEAKSRHCSFNPVESQGAYKLNLGNNFERSIAMYLVRIAGDNIYEQLKAAKLDHKPFDVGQLRKRPKEVPCQGQFELVFAKFKKRGGAGDIVGDKTFQRLKGMVTSEDKSDRDKSTIMQGFAASMHLGSDQIGTLMDGMEGSSIRITMLSQLFSSIVDRHAFEKIEAKLHASELIMLRKELGALYEYNEENPTNHYKLNMARKYDRQLANKILELNNDERAERKGKGLFDTSDAGFFMNFRNETIDGRKFVWTGTWTIPTTGVLEFDYVSTTRPHFGARAMSDQKLEEVSLITNLVWCRSSPIC